MRLEFNHETFTKRARHSPHSIVCCVGSAPAQKAGRASALRTSQRRPPPRAPPAGPAPQPSRRAAAGRATAGRPWGRRRVRPRLRAPERARRGPLRLYSQTETDTEGEHRVNQFAFSPCVCLRGVLVLAATVLPPAAGKEKRTGDLRRRLLEPLLLPERSVQAVAPPWPEAARAAGPLVRGRPARRRRHEAAEAALDVESGGPGQAGVHHRADARDGEGALRDARGQDNPAAAAAERGGSGEECRCECRFVCFPTAGAMWRGERQVNIRSARLS